MVFRVGDRAEGEELEEGVVFNYIPSILVNETSDMSVVEDTASDEAVSYVSDTASDNDTDIEDDAIRLFRALSRSLTGVVRNVESLNRSIKSMIHMRQRRRMRHGRRRYR